VPFVETPLNITVIFLTQDGMLVKSIAVPDVVATAVLKVIKGNVPVPTGNVITDVPDIALASIVTFPDVAPFNTMAMF
jgi:hypothetical protein